MALGKCFCGGDLVGTSNSRAEHEDLVEFFILYQHTCNKCPAVTMTPFDLEASKKSFEASKLKHGVYS